MWLRHPTHGYPGELSPRLVGDGGHASIETIGSEPGSCDPVIRPEGGEGTPHAKQVTCGLPEFAVEGEIRLRRQEARADSWAPIVLGPPVHTLVIPRQVLRGMALTTRCSPATPTVPMCWDPVTTGR